MMWTRRLWLKLQGLFGRNRNAQRLEDEIQFHLDQQIAENLAAGMGLEEARYAAMRTFGNPTVLKEETRDTWGWLWLEQMTQDFHYGLRSLRKSPNSQLSLSSALGIGANTAIFSLVDALVLRPLPVPTPAQILILGLQQGTGGVGSQFSVPEYRDIASQTSSAFSGVFGYWFGIDGLSVDARADRIATNSVTGNFFSTQELVLLFFSPLSVPSVLDLLFPAR